MLKKIFLHTDIVKGELFTELAPLADDHWFWAMIVLAGTKIKIPANSLSFDSFIDVEIESKKAGLTLASKNWNEGQYDVQFQRIIEHYPELLDKLIREAAEFVPKISIIAPIRNSAALQECLENIFTQSFAEFELIVVNCGARVELPNLPTNFRVINYPGGSLMDALNLGLQKSVGEYVMFKDESSILVREALDIIAQATDSKADVIHFGGHIQLDDEKILLDDAPELNTETPQFLSESSQIRAMLWLENKLSKRPDTKIFRREFLTRQKIIFGVDLAEFMFRALIDAEKYLLVPQVFSLIRE